MQEDQKLAIKNRLAEYLQSKGIDPSRPFHCLAHEERNPSMSFKNNRIKCFSCDWSGDIFDLIGLEYDLKSHKEIFLKAGLIFGHANLPSELRKQPDQYPSMPTPKKDYTRYFEHVKPLLRKTDYLLRRGISFENAERFEVGFDPKFRFRPNGTETPAIILCTGRNSFTVRSTLPQAKEGERFRKVGGSPLYLPYLIKQSDSPLIVTEGEIDALAVWEVGGCAMALGSTTNAIQFVNRVEKESSGVKIVLSLDNDDSGKATTKRIACELTKLGIDFDVCNISGGCKDPSEALQLNRDTFTQSVKGIYE